MHIWLSDILDHHRDIEVPGSHRLVVGSGDESPVLVHESDGVYGSKMLVVLLRDLAGIHIVLD